MNSIFAIENVIDCCHEIPIIFFEICVFDITFCNVSVGVTRYK